jgi:3-dehydroquinate synthase
MTVPLRSGDPTIVNVALGERSYDILIGRGQLASLGRRIAALRPGAKAAIVTDETVARHHLAATEAALAAAGIAAASVEVPPGESSKSFAMLQRVCEALIAARIERADLVVALGGGVIGDLAGFAAAVVRRGLDYVQVPTTLLAQVDSSVGGKTAIDSSHGKNLVGAFHQPVLVVADTALLDTLPQREFRAGYAEVAKYGLLGDAAFFAWLEANWRDVFAGGGAALASEASGQRGHSILARAGHSPEEGSSARAREHAIAVSCRMKAAIVARDERETGERALLNLGHTFGHAFEAAAGFSDRLLHGEAIALGMVLAFAFSARRGLLPHSEAERVARHLAAVGLPTRVAAVPGGTPDADRLMELIAQDKKVKRGKLTFILARGIGASFIASDVDAAEVRAFLIEKLAER